MSVTGADVGADSVKSPVMDGSLAVGGTAAGCEVESGAGASGVLIISVRAPSPMGWQLYPVLWFQIALMLVLEFLENVRPFPTGRST